MEEEGCTYAKFGFCKFRGSCMRKHFTEVCEDLSRCMKVKECHKRHPKICRRFSLEKECRFKDDCEYTHERSNSDNEKEVLKERVNILEKEVNELTSKLETRNLDQLEKVVHALTRKVLSLENEMEVMKDKIETVKQLSNENYLDKEPSFNASEVKESTSTPKMVKDKVKKDTKAEEVFNCKECSYKSKKEKTLKKHMVNNHETHKCKECLQNLPTVGELMKHLAEHHDQHEGDNKEETELGNISEKDIEKEERVKEKNVVNNKVFVFGRCP